MKNSKIIVLAVLLLAGLAAAYYFTVSKPDQGVVSGDAAQTADASSAVDAAAIDVDLALSERVLGNPSAPIKISEHSSFTCGHCGNFHKNSFAQVKAELVDTGKAYIVFSDFPLNAPALHASMVARCLPDQSRYFDFVQMLFEKQDEWAYDRNYLGYLKQYAADNGLDDAGLKACLGNERLQDGILARLKAAQDQWGISSTPSFVVNNRTVINGALSPAEFIAQVNEAAGVAVAPSVDDIPEIIEDPSAVEGDDAALDAVSEEEELIETP